MPWRAGWRTNRYAPPMGCHKATMNFAAMVADVFLEADLADIAVLCDFGNPRDGAKEGRCAR